MHKETGYIQPKVRLLKVVLMLCLSAAIVMGTMPCAPFVTTVMADDTEKTIACIGSDDLSLNCANVGAAKVYYGKYNGGELAWRVINYDGNGALFSMSENNLTLFAGGLIGYSRFSEGRDRNNKYGDSELKTEIDNIYSAYFTEKEKGAIKNGSFTPGIVTVLTLIVSPEILLQGKMHHISGLCQQKRQM